MDTLNDSTVYGSSHENSDNSDVDESKHDQTDPGMKDVSNLVRTLPRNPTNSSSHPNPHQTNPQQGTRENLGILSNMLKPVDEEHPSRLGPTIPNTTVQTFLRTHQKVGRKLDFGTQKPTQHQQQMVQQPQHQMVQQQPQYNVHYKYPSMYDPFKTPFNQQSINPYSNTNLKFSNTPPITSPSDVSMNTNTPPNSNQFQTPNPTNSQPNINTQQFLNTTNAPTQQKSQRINWPTNPTNSQPDSNTQNFLNTTRAPTQRTSNKSNWQPNPKDEKIHQKTPEELSAMLYDTDTIPTSSTNNTNQTQFDPSLNTNTTTISNSTDTFESIDETYGKRDPFQTPNNKILSNNANQLIVLRDVVAKPSPGRHYSPRNLSDKQIKLIVNELLRHNYHFFGTYPVNKNSPPPEKYSLKNLAVTDKFVIPNTYFQLFKFDQYSNYQLTAKSISLLDECALYVLFKTSLEWISTLKPQATPTYRPLTDVVFHVLANCRLETIENRKNNTKHVTKWNICRTKWRPILQDIVTLAYWYKHVLHSYQKTYACLLTQNLYIQTLKEAVNTLVSKNNINFNMFHLQNAFKETAKVKKELKDRLANESNLNGTIHQLNQVINNKNMEIQSNQQTIATLKGTLNTWTNQGKHLNDLNKNLQTRNTELEKDAAKNLQLANAHANRAQNFYNQFLKMQKDYKTISNQLNDLKRENNDLQVKVMRYETLGTDDKQSRNLFGSSNTNPNKP